MMNYPNGNKKTYSVKVSASRRGMSLEKEINLTNDYYLAEDKAVIHKKPTPVTIVKVDYPDRTAAKITEAYFKVPSTTDYNGIYKGQYLDFEAKECASKTSFPLSSIHAHQIKHLEAIGKHGGIGFLIVRFTVYEETYFVKAEDFIRHIHSTERHSVPYSWFQENGYLISASYIKPVDYLEVVDRIYHI